MRWAKLIPHGWMAAGTVLAWTSPRDEMADRNHPSSDSRQLCAFAARQRLDTAVQLALGGVPADLDFDPRMLRGHPGTVLVRVADAEGSVLVAGTGRRGPLRRLLAGHVGRYCLTHARCPVVAVPPHALAQFGHGLRGWAMRRHGLDPACAGLNAGWASHRIGIGVPGWPVRWLCPPHHARCLLR